MSVAAEKDRDQIWTSIETNIYQSANGDRIVKANILFDQFVVAQRCTNDGDVFNDCCFPHRFIFIQFDCCGISDKIEQINFTYSVLEIISENFMHSLAVAIYVLCTRPMSPDF